MRIGIDGRIFMKPGSGTVRYAFELMQHLLDQDTENEYLIYVPEKSDYKNKLSFKGIFTVRPLKLPPILWRTVLFTKILDRDRIDVYHSMQYILPYVPSWMRRVAMTTSSQGMLSEFPNLKEQIYWLSNYKTTAMFCDHMIAVSQQLKKELQERYRMKPEKIDVTMTGVPDSFFNRLSEKEKESERRRLAKKYNLGETGYIIYAGAGMAPNKNVDTVLKAWKILKEKYAFNIPIIITRVKLHLLKSKLDALGLIPNSDVICMEWVEEQDIIPLYSCAELTVYASLYEGFGSVIIESQATGTPVVISNISAMPEAAGGAAILVNDPRDQAEWAEKVFGLYNDAVTKKKLIELGLENAKKYTYRNIAKATIDAYRDTAKAKGNVE